MILTLFKIALSFTPDSMKKTATALSFLLVIFTGFAQMPALQQKAIVVKRLIETKHYSPRPVDDSLSADMFRNIINSADPRRLLFTEADYKKLLNFQYQLDDELNGKGWAFADAFADLYKKGLQRADSLINKLLQKPFDYTTAETLTQYRNRNTFLFATDASALSAKWSRYLKYSILRRLYYTLQEDSVNTLSLKAALATKEAATRERVKKSESKSLKKSLDFPAGFPVLIEELYLDALTTCFDPHTNFMSAEAMTSFQSALSTEGYFFGIDFEESESGKVVIEKLTPGGPAWKSGEMNKGDEVVSLQWEGAEVQDMGDAELEEVYDVLDQHTHEKLLFRLKKTDGTMSMVFLKKEKLENEENIVKGFVMNGEKKIGYIVLPGFYTEWENETGSGCANDIAKEIIKLKRENIDGLVLDVRYNGGGSLGEAMEMIGIFVEEGPLMAIKDRSSKLTFLKDPNRGTIYDGPMALMINTQSASASELLAASLKDYHRAVIVGSNTHGKATMQEMMFTDTITSRRPQGGEKRDVIKITTGKLYKLDGRTAQKFGVSPDVPLPDAYEGLETGERFLRYALPADTVKPNNYYKPLPYLPVKDLAARSAARVSANSDFQLIKKITEEQKKEMQMDSRSVPLKADLFEVWAKQRDKELDIVKGEAAATGAYKPGNHTGDIQLLAGNAYAKELNDDWLERLAEDIYLQEACRVVTDLINIQKNTTKN